MKKKISLLGALIFSLTLLGANVGSEPNSKGSECPYLNSIKAETDNKRGECPYIQKNETKSCPYSEKKSGSEKSEGNKGKLIKHKIS